MSQVAEETVCRNCGAELVRAYCAECGQKAGPPNPSFRHLWHELSEELFHLDGKIVESVRLLLFKPGFLTREYVDGRRARYVTPLRLYLIFSVVYFGVLAIMPADAGRRSSFNIEITQSANETAAELETELQKAGFANQDEAKRSTNEAVLHRIPQAMFVLVPFFALLVAIVTWGSGVNYPQHLYFALHVHAAWYAVSALAQVAWLVPNVRMGDTLRGIGVAYVVIYFVMAMKRVYRKTVLGALWRAAVIGPIYLLTIVMVAVGIALVWLYVPAVRGAAPL
jgi:hypothetical protein